MHTPDTLSPDTRPPRGNQQLTVLELMILIAGVAVGIWLVAKDLTSADNTIEFEDVMAVVIAVLGGLSVVGPPLLLLEWRRRRVHWHAGKVLWFAQGMASWLLWPPVVYTRLRGKGFNDSMSGMCWFYGTPLMAIYVTLALLSGGWLRRSRRRRLGRSWREQFGLLLGMAWACSGFYILYLLYAEDF